MLSRSTLIDREAECAALFTAARTTSEINRRQLLEDLARWSDETLYPEDYSTRRALFNLLLDLRTSEPLVVPDKFQYLADGIAFERNDVWEQKQPPRSFLLMLAGSAIGTMEAP